MRQQEGGRRGADVANERHAALVRLAVRYASLWDVTITEAAKEFGVARASVSAAWRAMYPGRQQPRRRS